jgi:hypothetical protein
VITELGAETTHVDVDGSRAAKIIVSPHFGEQLLPAENSTGICNEEAEEFEFLEGEVERATSSVCLETRFIDPHSRV